MSYEFLREGWQWESHAFGRGLKRTARPGVFTKGHAQNIKKKLPLELPKILVF